MSDGTQRAASPIEVIEETTTSLLDRAGTERWIKRQRLTHPETGSTLVVSNIHLTADRAGQGLVAISLGLDPFTPGSDFSYWYDRNNFLDEPDVSDEVTPEQFVSAANDILALDEPKPSDEMAAIARHAATLIELAFPEHAEDLLPHEASMNNPRSSQPMHVADLARVFLELDHSTQYLHVRSLHWPASEIGELTAVQNKFESSEVDDSIALMQTIVHVAASGLNVAFTREQDGEALFSVYNFEGKDEPAPVTISIPGEGDDTFDAQGILLAALANVDTALDPLLHELSQ